MIKKLEEENIKEDKEDEEEEEDLDCNDYGFSFIDNPELDGRTIKFIAKDGLPNSDFLQALSEMFNVEFTIIAWSDPGYYYEGAVIPIRFPNFHPDHKYYEWDNNNDCVSGW